MARWLPALIPGNRAGAYAGRGLLNAMSVIGYQRPRRSRVLRVDEPGTVRGEWVGGPARPGQRVLYYLHGSGYIGCSPATHRGLVTQLTSRTGRPAFVLRYRRGPEHRFPAAHQDAVDGFLWLLGQGFDPADIVVAGDSAGGHLTVALCGELRRRGIAQPAGAVLMSPLIDPTYNVAAEHESVSRDPFIGVGIARRLTGLYTAGADTTDPRLDVCRDVGADLPPMLIQAGGREILRADAEQYAAALQLAGGTCELQIWPGQIHVFQIFYRVLPEARDALDRIQRFIADLDTSASHPNRASTA
ncbi:alpha/beta hydrolase [Nocardia sp. NBC_00511]|uniref:alpha/beta hydrolase n=1 Tax=Nocardia sp. NBC_00511 TaxID=2903591 RepID=UPI0030E5698B